MDSDGAETVSVWILRRPTDNHQLVWYRPKSHHTKVYEQYVLLQLVNSTVTDVSIKEGIGYEAVVGVIERHVAKHVDWEACEAFEILGLDEIALKKGHRDFVAIVTARHRDGRVR